MARDRIAKRLTIAAVAVLASCGGGTHVGLTDRPGWIAAETQRLGYTPDADQLSRLQAAHEETCHLKHDAFEAYVAAALDERNSNVIDLPVHWFCPGRAGELRKILAGLPGADTSEYG